MDYSQDLFRTQTQFQRRPIYQPFEFDCKEVSRTAGPLVKPPCSSSKDLPSLRGLEYVGDVLTIDTLMFPIEEVLNLEGLDTLFSHVLSLLVRLKKNESMDGLRTFLEGLDVIKYVGLSGQLRGSLFTSYLEWMHRLLLKTDSFEFRHKETVLRNVSVHISLLTWTVCVEVSDQDSDKSDDSIVINQFRKDVLLIIAAGLSRLYDSHKSVSCCTCMETLLIRVLRDHCFLSGLRRLFDCNQGKVSLSSGRSSLLNEVTSPMSLFSFYLESISHFIERKCFDSNGDICSSFLPLAFGMADKLSSSDIVSTSHILSQFLLRCSPGGVDRCKKPARVILKSVLNYVEETRIDKLESFLERGSAEWAFAVENILDYTEKEMSPIKLLIILLSKHALWESCRSILLNNFSGAKISANSSCFGTMLTLIFSVILHTATDSHELLLKLHDWLREGCERTDRRVRIGLFTAVETMHTIGLQKYYTVDVDSLFNTLLKKLPLRESGSLFVEKFGLIKNLPRDFDFDRPGRELSGEHFILFTKSLRVKEIEVGNVIYERALNMLSGDVQGKDELVLFIATQLRLGWKRGSYSASARFQQLITKVMLPNRFDLWPLLLRVCNEVLRRPCILNQSSRPVFDKIVSVWILMVCAHSKSHEMETQELTGMVWEHIISIIREVSPNCAIPTTQFFNPEEHIITLFRLLSDIPKQEWMFDRLNSWFPRTLATSFDVVLRQSDVDSRDRTLRIVARLFIHLSQPLWCLVKLAESRSESRSTATFVTMSMKVEKYLGSLPCTSDEITKLFTAYCSLPHDLFIVSRIKRFLTAFEKSGVFPSLICALRTAPKEVLNNIRADSNFKNII